jgi:hypothetical protein
MLSSSLIERIEKDSDKIIETGGNIPSHCFMGIRYYHELINSITRHYTGFEPFDCGHRVVQLCLTFGHVTVECIPYENDDFYLLGQPDDYDRKVLSIRAENILMGIDDGQDSDLRRQALKDN